MITREILNREAKKQMADGKIAYAHFQLRRDYGEWEKTISYATVALGEVNGQIIFGIGYCSVKDQFNRKVGRMAALRKLMTDPRKLTITIDDKRPHTLAHYALNEALKRDSYPNKIGAKVCLPTGSRKQKKED